MRFTLVAGATLLIAATATAQEIPAPGTILPPSPVRTVRAEYTRQAREAGIEGTVLLNALVLADGTVGDGPTVKVSLDQRFGLDDRALEASKQWRFKPATKDGEPVAAPVVIEHRFRLKTR